MIHVSRVFAAVTFDAEKVRQRAVNALVGGAWAHRRASWSAEEFGSKSRTEGHSPRCNRAVQVATVAITTSDIVTINGECANADASRERDRASLPGIAVQRTASLRSAMPRRSRRW